MTAARDLTREDLLVRLVEVVADRDALARELNRERILNEDLRRELSGLRMFHLQMVELAQPGGYASDDQIVGTVKIWLVFFRQVAALCPRAQIPGTMVDWVREIKIKAAEYDKEVF
jgi:hypothetical protein